MTIVPILILAASMAAGGPIDPPAPRPAEPALAPSKSKGTRAIVHGQATWYGTGPGRGHAAAGPALRRAIGKQWRGSLVHVCANGRCMQVVLDDWCHCGGKHVIDLSKEDFATLAPLSRGVIEVTIKESK